MDDRLLKRMLALPEGQRTDAFLRYLLEPRFMGYWTFARPKSKGIELADVLVWFDDTVLLFEAKTREGGQASEAWIKRSLGEAMDQINRRVEILRSGEVASLVNPWRGEVQWHPELVRGYYGVVVLNHLSDPYDPHELATESFRTSKVPIQVFSLEDVAELLRFISTPMDFIVYYELRHAYLRKWKAKVHEEASTYGSIVHDMSELRKEVIGTARNIHAEREFQRAVSRVMVRPPEGRKRDYARVAASYLVDLAMGGVARRFADIEDPGARSIEWETVEMVGTIAEMSRVRRSLWGQRWLDIAKEAVRSERGFARFGHSPKRKRAYVFAASEKAEDERAEWLLPEAHRAMAELDCNSCVVLVANPRKLLRAFEVLKEWMRGRAAEMPEDGVLDATMIWVGTRTILSARPPESLT